MAPSYTFPEAGPHGNIEEIRPNVYMVTGEVSVTMGLKMAFSRNMIILKQNTDLILINSMRLSEAGLAELDELGTVKHIIRLTEFHGMDDPFYKARYHDANVWAVQGTAYNKGFKFDESQSYFTPDEWMNESTSLPVPHAKLILLEGKKPPIEANLFLQDSKILIVGDSLQNYPSSDRYFNWFGTIVMYMMGFIKPFNVGPAWLKACEIDPQILVDKLLVLQFEHVLPSHGMAVKGDAWKKYEPAVQALLK